MRRSGRAWKKLAAEFGESVYHRPAVARTVASGMQPMQLLEGKGDWSPQMSLVSPAWISPRTRRDEHPRHDTWREREKSDHCASWWKEMSHPVVCLPALQQFPFVEDCIWWVSTGHGDSNNRKKKHCSWWCMVCGGKYEWRAPTKMRQKYSERTRPHKGHGKI